MKKSAEQDQQGSVRLYCFHQGKGNNGELWLNTFDGSKWTRDQQVPNTGVSAGPSAVFPNSMSMYATPMVTMGDVTPTIPTGLKLATDPVGIPYPILRWGGYAYWPLSYVDDREAMVVTAYDEAGSLVQEWSQDGARYIARIVESVSNQTVTFVGQAENQFVMAWNDLVVPPQIIESDALTQAPHILSGLRLAPDTSGAKYPVLKWGEYLYWSLSYLDDRVAMVIVAYDHAGNLVQAWSREGARDIEGITVDAHARTVTFTGQTGGSFSISWDALDLSYSTCYQATADELLAVAATYGLPLTQEDAAALAAALPMFSCANCGRHAQAATMARGLSVEVFWGTVGSIVGGVVGAAAGALIGGPPGGYLGLTLGASVGANIGLQVDLTPPSYTYTPGSLEASTFVYMQNFPIGPFTNSSVFTDLERLNSPRYGQIDMAGALAPSASGNRVQVYYPTQQQITTTILTPYRPMKTNMGDVYKFIFVIVQVLNQTQDEQPAYQLRMHPEDCYLHGPDRINHSQLSEGTRFAALMGLPSMQVYAAGSLYLLNGQIIGIDSRTGHYYWSFDGKDQEDINAALDFTVLLGYNKLSVLQWGDLTEFLSDMW